MSKKHLKIVNAYVLIIILINGYLLSSQLRSDWGHRPDLDFSKSFANEIVNNMQNLAEMLGVEERSNVKQALAQLHYDVYLVANRNELAPIVQNDATNARNLIISEYIKFSAEQALLVLNNAQEVHRTNTKTVLNILPLPEGGFTVAQPHILSAVTIDELSQVPTIFSFDYFRNLYESYRSLAAVQVEIEGGTARVSTPQNDQDTIRYWEREIQNLRNAYGQISQAAGFSEISGPGISISIHDRLFSIEAIELRRIAGEIFSAGATAITIGGQRLSVNSYIVDTQDGVSIDGVLIDTNPVIIEAIGDQNTLVSGIDLLFSVVMPNMFYINTELHERITLPARTNQ